MIATGASSSVETGCLHCGLPVPVGRREDIGPRRFCCLGCEMVHVLVTAGPEGSENPAAGTLFLRLGMSVFLTINLMAVSWFSYSREVFGSLALAVGSDRVLTEVFNYFSWLLATGVLCLLGLPLVFRARTGRRAENHPITVGISSRWLVVGGVFSAYLLSMAHTFRGEGSLYFDTAAVVLVVVSIGQLLEARARRRASTAAVDLLAELPELVRIEGRDGVVEVERESLQANDSVILSTGDGVPADGVITRGFARIDSASLTGEARPAGAGPGDSLLAGSLVVDGSCRLRVSATGRETVLASMERTLQQARSARPPTQRLADRVSTVFVPLVVLLAGGVLLNQSLAGRFEEGLLRALSVMLISCPCALGLAAPLACWHGLRRAASHGILLDSAASLEGAAAISRVMLDKTGTLTRHRLVLSRTVTSAALDPAEALALGTRLEGISRHPLARVLRASTEGEPARLPREPLEVPGLGVQGRIDGQTLRLGSRRWATLLELEDSSLLADEKDGRGFLYLMDQRQILARFELEEELRAKAVEVVVALREMGLELRILSGDDRAATEKVGQALGVPAEGGLLPADKVRHLEAARTAGRRARVAMVGDGLNDAPVLAAADLGIALGSAAEWSRRSGQVRLLDDRLERLPLLFRLAREVRSTLRLNLLWAFGFNGIGLALAASGRLTPVFAAVAMVISSLMVVHLSSRAGLRATTDFSSSAFPAPSVPSHENRTGDEDLAFSRWEKTLER